jgi:hypothetical protein
MLHACFVYDSTCFMCTFMKYLAFSGTNLLTKCRSARSYFLLFLYFRSFTHEIFSEFNETKPQYLISPEGTLCQKEGRRGAATWPYQGQVWAPLWPHLPLVWAPCCSVCSSLSPIYSAYRENPRYPSLHPRKVPPPPSS